MTGTRRVSRNGGEPAMADPSGPERWADYLDWLREDIIRGVLGLPESDRRVSRLPSGWSPIELLSHVLHMEQRWFVWGFLAEVVPAPWGDWNVEDPSREPATGDDPPRWAVADGVDAEELAERLRAQGRRTRSLILEHDPVTPARTGGRFVADPPTLEWICFHVMAEYARHAGQLDVVVELSPDH